MTFIVRLARDEAGRVTGIVERVRTGQKERFEGLGAIAPLLARMFHSEPHPTRGEDTP